MRSRLSHVTTPHPSFALSCYVTPFRLGPLLQNWKQRTKKRKGRIETFQANPIQSRIEKTRTGRAEYAGIPHGGPSSQARFQSAFRNKANFHLESLAVASCGEATR